MPKQHPSRRPARVTGVVARIHTRPHLRTIYWTHIRHAGINAGCPLLIGPFEDQESAATTYDVAAMILGREPVNNSRAAYEAAPRAPLALVWRSAARLLAAQARTFTVARRLAATPNPFDPDQARLIAPGDRQHAKASRPRADH